MSLILEILTFFVLFVRVILAFTFFSYGLAFITIWGKKN